VDLAIKLFGSKKAERDEPGVSLIGNARGPSRSLRPLWEASTARIRVDDAPSWNLPALWEEPSDEQEVFLAGRATRTALPAQERTWQQPVLF
jgi:hypothetical protein